MSLFEVVSDDSGGSKGLVPFPQETGRDGHYESHIEDLIWSDLETFVGESIFPVGRQRKLPSGLIPDILALDESGSIVVIEVKRGGDRQQLAQVLEYAGWAQTTSLEEVADLYRVGSTGHSGPEAFFRDWQEFTGTEEARRLHDEVRMIVVAEKFHPSTSGALDFLADAGVHITVLPITIYRSFDDRRLIHVDVETELESSCGPIEEHPRRTRKDYMVDGRRVRVDDLIDPTDPDLLDLDEEVVFHRNGETHRAVIRSDGSFLLEDGRTFTSPSSAGANAAELVACRGWTAWRVVRLGEKTLHELRKEYIKKATPLNAEGP